MDISYFLLDGNTFRFKYIQPQDEISKQSYSPPTVRNPALKFLPHRKFIPDVTIWLTRTNKNTNLNRVLLLLHHFHCTNLSGITPDAHGEEENRNAPPALLCFPVTHLYRNSTAACKAHTASSFTMSQTHFTR